MKTLLLSLLLLLFSFAAVAQHTASSDITENKLFVGVGISNTNYPIMGETKHEVINTIVPIANVHVGYKLNKRTTVQLGIGYGANEINGYRIAVSGGNYGDFHRYERIRGIVTPLTVKWTPFKPYKRLQLYANASLAPVFGHMKARATETYDEEVITLYDDKFYTFDLVATAGLSLNYRLNKRLDIYADGILLYKNLYFLPASGNYFRGKSAGIGLNYNLTLKRER